MPYKDADKGRAHNKEWRKANKERLREKAIAYYNDPDRKAIMLEYQKDWRSKRANRMRMLFLAARSRATERGLEIEEALLAHLMAAPASHCDCCFMELEYSSAEGRNPLSPSLDRFDNGKGYMIANVRVLCLRCNTLKRDATLQELQMVYDYMTGKGAS